MPQDCCDIEGCETKPTILAFYEGCTQRHCTTPHPVCEDHYVRYGMYTEKEIADSDRYAADVKARKCHEDQYKDYGVEDRMVCECGRRMKTDDRNWYEPSGEYLCADCMAEADEPRLREQRELLAQASALGRSNRQTISQTSGPSRSQQIIRRRHRKTRRKKPVCIFKNCKNEPTMHAHMNGCLGSGCSTAHPICEECFAEWNGAANDDYYSGWSSQYVVWLPHEVQWTGFTPGPRGTDCRKWRDD